MTTATRPVGDQLRHWRQRRRLSQLELAVQAQISTRHLSFVETGRSHPTAAMIRRITEELDVPLRERNQLLLAGGYAPSYSQRELAGPELAMILESLRAVLAGHGPFPALVLNRWWELIDSNPAVDVLVAGCAPELLEPPVNVLRLSLHPAGLAPRIVNLGQWRARLLQQLQHRIDATGDNRLIELAQELRGYPGDRVGPAPTGLPVLPLVLRADDRELSFFSMAAAVETATDVTVSELVLEAFYPADAATAAYLHHGITGDRGAAP